MPGLEVRPTVSLRSLLAATAVTITLAGCGLTDVSNPGPIQDDALNNPAAGPTVLVGLVSDVEMAVNVAAYYAGVASTDLNADATQGWVQNMGDGRLISEESSYIWDEAHAARWTASRGIERLMNTQDSPQQSPLVAAAHLWAGYASRIIGDFACVSIVDGGAPLPNDENYRIAIGHFETARDMAISIGPSLDSIRVAAIAGLAQAHLALSEYSQAASYAAQVPDNFLWVAHRSGNSTRENNRIWEATIVSTMATVHGTYSAELGPSADPRTRWIDLEKTGAGGARPYYQQQKYADRGDDIPLAKGAEMRLIEAEVLLRASEVGDAMDIINAVRSAAGVPAVSAATEAEAWVALDRERHLALWMEGRRLRDNVRLAQPGLSSWSAEYMQGRDACFPPSLSEIASNPNL